MLGATRQVADTLAEDSWSVAQWDTEKMARVVVTQVYERTTCARLLANAIPLL